MKFSKVPPMLSTHADRTILVLGEIPVHYMNVPETIPLTCFKHIVSVREYLLKNPPLDDEHLLVVNVMIDDQQQLSAAVIAFTVSDDNQREQKEFICCLGGIENELGPYILPMVNRLLPMKQAELRRAADALTLAQTTVNTLNTLRERLSHE